MRVGYERVCYERVGYERVCRERVLYKGEVLEVEIFKRNCLEFVCCNCYLHPRRLDNLLRSSLLQTR